LSICASVVSFAALYFPFEFALPGPGAFAVPCRRRRGRGHCLFERVDGGQTQVGEVADVSGREGVACAGAYGGSFAVDFAVSAFYARTAGLILSFAVEKAVFPVLNWENGSF
jgi:hypothetical protein